MVERLHGQVRMIQWLRAGGRREVFDIVLSFFPRDESAQSIFGHVRRGMPKGQPDRASLKDSQGAVSYLESSGGSLRSIGCHLVLHQQDDQNPKGEYNKVVG